MKKILIAACALLALVAHAGGLESLETFIRSTHAGHAEFTQVVTAPGKNGEAPRTKRSAGSFDFVRPNRFRFVYQPPLAQTIVADGQTLWLFDADLNQVTARSQVGVMAASPAALIASAANLKALQADFNLTSEPDQDGLQWVLATPRAHDTSLQSIRVGLRNNLLAVLDILDSFGQRSVMTFGSLQTATTPDLALFQFKPPAGADVIRQ